MALGVNLVFCRKISRGKPRFIKSKSGGKPRFLRFTPYSILFSVF
jgi:hypothetical protein